MTFTKDGDPDFKWEEFRPDSLHLQTPYPILDAAFSLAVDEALTCIAPGRYYYWTKGGGMREYTRDTAQHVQWVTRLTGLEVCSESIMILMGFALTPVCREVSETLFMQC